ncbi:MAG: AraC family transcriptional regulator [Rhodocyclales bacterium]|nr:AraC family transcriptional regulator [Rhodocyclales bacterium]
MTETPHVTTETPPASTDLLSDLLGSMRLSGMVMFRADFREPWAVITPDSTQLARVLPFRTEHIIPFHVIAAGGCWLEMPGGEPVWLREGDAVLLPYGDGHRLGGRQTATAVHVGQLLPRLVASELQVVRHGGEGDAASIICGFLQCDELLFRPFLRHLPALLHVSPGDNPDDNWLAGTIRHTAREASAPMAGSRSMLPRLTELMFVEILRKHIQQLSADEVGWFAAFNDPVVGAALKFLHGAPLHDWSVAELARRVGASRTVLAERFKYFLDQPPMHYLAGWRLRLAAQELKTTDLPLKTIAEHSGYESEAAFGRAFKRQFGAAPGDWRRQAAPSSMPRR